MSNSNFRCDCRNNVDNCSFQPIYGKTEELSYIKNYANILLSDQYNEFTSPPLLHDEIENEYNKSLFKLDTNDPCYETRNYSIGQKILREIDAVDSMLAKKKHHKRIELKKWRNETRRCG